MSLRLILLSATAAAALAVPCPAQLSSGIATARQAGTVGERYDGYLGLRAAVPDAVRKQVGAVNIKRRALYSDLAAKRGVSPQEVGITAGCQLLGRVAVGEFYLLADTSWRRRDAGQAAPHPDYCG